MYSNFIRDSHYLHNEPNSIFILKVKHIFFFSAIQQFSLLMVAALPSCKRLFGNCKFGMSHTTISYNEMERWKRFEKLGAIKSVNKKDQRLMVLAIFVFPYLWVWHDFISGKPAYLGHYTFSPRQRISYKNEKVYFNDMELLVNKKDQGLIDW